MSGVTVDDVRDGRMLVNLCNSVGPNAGWVGGTRVPFQRWSVAGVDVSVVVAVVLLDFCADF